MSPDTALLLADLILLLHWSFVSFIAAGLAAVWLGAALGWRFVRLRWLRIAHMAAMGVVLGESVLGIFCPLTEWEFRLRLMANQGGRYETTFMDYWARRIFYWDLPESAFLGIYAGFFLLMTLTWICIPPRDKRGGG